MKYPLQFKAAVLEKNNANLSIKRSIFKGPLKKGQILIKLKLFTSFIFRISYITFSLYTVRNYA